MSPLCPVLLLLGLFAPGFFIARSLHQKPWWPCAFAFSLLVLFHVVFWLGICGVPISVWTVLPCLLAACAGAAWWMRRTAPPPEPASPKAAWTTGERALLALSGLASAAMLAPCVISPLIGFDTLFRWDFLAQRLLYLGRFDFYPPLAAADFRTYFFVDGIPPLVSFGHWWLYASAGRYMPQLIWVFAAAQWACTLAFVYSTAAALFSRRAGVLAVAALAACPLFFLSAVLGQETGLTSLSIAAMLYFIVTARQPGDMRAMVSAGLAAALCALCREYGWMALVAGGIALLWRRQPLKQVLVFAAVAVSLAAPWYARTWILTGNPFYSLRFGGFAVNPIHDAILQYYRSVLAPGQWSGGSLLVFGSFLLLQAPLQIVAGIPGACTQLRRRGYLLATVLIGTAVWLEAAGYTSDGVGQSIRVLGPVMVVLSIAAAGFLERWSSSPRALAAIAAAILLCQLWAAAGAALYPRSPRDVPFNQWARFAYRPVPDSLEYLMSDQLAALLAPGSRVLSDSANLHAALVDKGIDVVPVWSPEVRFIFTAPPGESEQRLRAAGIATVAYYPQSLNTRFLAAASPFYASLPQRWRIRARAAGVMYLLVPAEP